MAVHSAFTLPIKDVLSFCEFLPRLTIVSIPINLLIEVQLGSFTTNLTLALGRASLVHNEIFVTSNSLRH